MLLRRKHKPNNNEQPIPHVWSWQATEREEVSRSEPRAAQFVELSRLSAKLVELSLREAKRDLTLPGTVPDKLNAVSSPLLWPSIEVQRIAQPPAGSTGGLGMEAEKDAAAVTHLNPLQAHGTARELRRPKFVVLHSRATVILREMTNYWHEGPRTLGSWLARLRAAGSAVGDLSGWRSVEKDHQLATFRAGILCGLRIVAQRTEVIRQRTVLLIGHWSSWTANTARFLAERISARTRILANSQPLWRLRHGCRKILHSSKNMELQEKVSRLEKELQETKAKLHVIGNVQRRDGFIYHENEPDPCCSHCFDTERILIRIVETHNTKAGLGMSPYCPHCKTIFGGFRPKGLRSRVVS